jgi:hypothetical protein
MISIDPKVSKDANGKTKSVTLTAEDWDQVLDELEELDDIRAFDEALADDSPSIPFEEAIAEIEKNKLSD